MVVHLELRAGPSSVSFSRMVIIGCGGSMPLTSRVIGGWRGARSLVAGSSGAAPSRKNQTFQVSSAVSARWAKPRAPSTW